MSRKLENDELNRLRPSEFREAEKLPVVVILENVRSAMNVGSVFRSCDAFRIEKICLCGYTATPPNREIQKTALGATETVSWEYYKDTIDVINRLKNDGYKIFAIEQVEKSIMLDKFLPEKNNSYAFIFGNEVRGVEQNTVNTCDGVIEVPQFGSKHSLNIAVCAGIVLWHSVLKIK
jgi:23S rRNA (guanosine2251-2'-O)-methyltransferase